MPKRPYLERLAEALEVDADTLSRFIEEISPSIDNLLKVLMRSKPPKKLLEKQVYLQKIEKTVKGHRYTYIQVCVKEYIAGRKRETCMDTRGNKRLIYLVIAREMAKIMSYLEENT